MRGPSWPWPGAGLLHGRTAALHIPVKAPTPSAPASPRAPSGRAGRRAGPPPVGRRPPTRPWPYWGEAVEAGAKDILGARWVAVDGGYANRPFVEGVRKDAVLRFPYTGPHARQPGRKRQCDRCFDRRDPARMARTTLKDEKVDLYHGLLQAPRPGGAAPRPLFPAQSQGPQLRAGNRPTICRLVGRGSKRPQCRGRPPHPARTPVAARTPSRNGADRSLNAIPQPVWQHVSGLKTVQTIYNHCFQDTLSTFITSSPR